MFIKNSLNVSLGSLRQLQVDQYIYIRSLQIKIRHIKFLHLIFQ